jgi:predicted nucleic acid-binding protein
MDRLVAEPGELVAPYLLQAEFASGLRRLESRGLLSTRAADQAWDALMESDIDYRWDTHWVERATAIARRAGLSKVYDSIYLACAETYGFDLYTSDARFCRALGANLPPFVRLITT